MGTWRLGGGRGGGGGGGRRAQRRARPRANARREVRARQPQTPQRPRRGCAREASPLVGPRRESRPPPPPTLCATGRPGRDRAVARARPRGAGGRARDHPAAHGRRGDGNPARAHGRRHRACGGRPCVREGRFATPPVGSFEHAVFSRGFSRPRAPHDARRAGGSGEGLLERFAPRRLHRAVVEAPPPMACAAECANGTARCAPKRVEKL